MTAQIGTDFNRISATLPASSMLMLMTLAIGFVMAMIDVTAVNVALPDIALSLSIPLSGLVWVVDGYTLTFAALLLAGGALADRFGPKNVYQGGLTIFILGSVLCGAPRAPLSTRYMGCIVRRGQTISLGPRTADSSSEDG